MIGGYDPDCALNIRLPWQCGEESGATDYMESLVESAVTCDQTRQYRERDSNYVVYHVIRIPYHANRTPSGIPPCAAVQAGPQNTLLNGIHAYSTKLGAGGAALCNGTDCLVGAGMRFCKSRNLVYKEGLPSSKAAITLTARNSALVACAM
jgi:hypothetical protein